MDIFSECNEEKSHSFSILNFPFSITTKAAMFSKANKPTKQNVRFSVAKRKKILLNYSLLVVH
ncbi:hypothetical protein [Clostridium tetani]|nr:hypothetical protein [Clostridium tetani]